MSQAQGVNALLRRVTAPEATFGSNPSSMGGVTLPINRSSLKSERNLITPGTITGRRDAVEPAQGFTNVSGEVTVPVDQCAIGYWLQMVLGYPTTTYVGSARSHVFTVSSLLNSFVLETGFADVSNFFKFNGCKASGMSLTCGGDEELIANISILGANEARAAATVVTPATAIALNRFNQFHATLTVNGAAATYIRTIDLNINNNLDESVYTIGAGATRGAIPEGVCNVNGRIEAMFENASLYTVAFSGSEGDIALKFQVGSFYLEFDMDEVLYKRSSPEITPGGIWLPFDFEAYYNNGAGGSVLKTTLVNTWASYSAQAA